MERAGLSGAHFAVFLSLLLTACSPSYVLKAAAGHGSLLLHRRSIAKGLKDPKTPEPLKVKLRLVQDVRAFAFDSMGLSKSRDYSTYTPVEGPVTFIVSGSSKTSLTPYLWRFPVIGSFPYKGYFKKADALGEAESLRARGFDACVSGAAAYNTPLWVSDPVPTAVLEDEAGAVASLILHELTHGTVSFKDQTRFDEALAGFVGDQGAEDFFKSRGERSQDDLEALYGERRRIRAFRAAIDEVYRQLDALYRGPESEEEKLFRREALFALGRQRLKDSGFDLGPLDNAVILAHRLYHEDLSDFKTAYDRHGGDWQKLIAFFRSLDAKRPAADLKHRLESLARPGPGR